MSAHLLPVSSVFVLLALVGCDGKPDAEDTGEAGETGDTGETDSGETDSGETGDTDSGETGDTDSGETDSGETGDTDSGETGGDSGDGDSGDTGWSGRDTADTGAETGGGDTDTGGAETGCDRDDCGETGGRETGGDTGEVCDRDDCRETGDAGDTGDTGDGDETGDACDRDEGCDTTDTGEGDTGGDDDTGDDDTGDDDTGETGEPERRILIATYADWAAETGTYSVWSWPDGAEIIAGVPLDSRDNVVDCDTDRVFLNARLTGTNDTISTMDPTTGVLGEQWVLDVDANPWDVDWIDGAYWVSLYGGARIDLYDTAGVVTESIDLSPWADSDGTSEPAGTWQDGAHTYVVLSGHDESRGAYGTPQLLQLDTATRTVNWSLSMSGSLVGGIGHRVGDLLYVQNQGTLTYGMGGPTPNLDGGFEIVDLSGPSTTGFVLAEADLNVTFDSFVAIPGTATGWLVVTDQDTLTQTVEFADLEAGTITSVFPIGGYTVRRISLDDDGTFWTLEIDSSTGATTSAWVHRDASFAEIERFDLGEGLYQMAICSI